MSEAPWTGTFKGTPMIYIPTGRKQYNDKTKDEVIALSKFKAGIICEQIDYIRTFAEGEELPKEKGAARQYKDGQYSTNDEDDNIPF